MKKRTLLHRNEIFCVKENSIIEMEEKESHEILCCFSQSLRPVGSWQNFEFFGFLEKKRKKVHKREK